MKVVVFTAICFFSTIINAQYLTIGGGASFQSKPRQYVNGGPWSQWRVGYTHKRINMSFMYSNTFSAPSRMRVSELGLGGRVNFLKPSRKFNLFLDVSYMLPIVANPEGQVYTKYGYTSYGLQYADYERTWVKVFPSSSLGIGISGTYKKICLHATLSQAWQKWSYVDENSKKGYFYNQVPRFTIGAVYNLDLRKKATTD